MSVYYLKYRPQKISQLDLTNVREQLSLMLASKNIPHALLFSGPKGLGKTSAARIVAKAINCELKAKSSKLKAQSIEPCNKCGICQSITNGTCLDLIEIDAASNRGIDDVRELRDKIKLSPSQLSKKVYVIDEVHMLTNEAFNALLKTLEEPPEHAFFILCTTEPEKLPETIISRCQRFDFMVASEAEIVRSLRRVVKGEKLKADDKVLALIAGKSQGSFRDAAKILQQLAFSGKKISLREASELLEKQGDVAEDILKALAANNIPQALVVLGKGVKKGADLKELTKDVLENLRQLLLAKHGISTAKDYGLSLEQIGQLITLFDQAGRQLKNSVVPSLPLELAIVKFGERGHFSEEKKAVKTPRRWPDGLLRGGENRESLTNVQDKWQQVLALIKKENPQVEGLLKSTNLKLIKNEKIIIEVFYQFHKSKLETTEYVSLVEEKIKAVFGKPLKIQYTFKNQNQPRGWFQESNPRVAENEGGGKIHV